MYKFDRSKFHIKKKSKLDFSSLKKIIKDLIIDTKFQDNFNIIDISSLNQIKENSILFINNIESFPKNIISKKILIITDKIDIFNKNYSSILVKNFNFSYNQIINELFLHDDHVDYNDDFEFINNSFISKYAKIDSSSIIFNGCTIGRGVEIGKNCIIKNNVIVKNAILANNIIISDNSTIGSTGFGFDLASMGAKNINPQIGIVYIDENTHIGSNCTIDRGKIDMTYIGKNTMIDNMVHIAHNVKIGNNVCIAAQCGISGSVNIGSNVIIGGQVGFAGHISVGNNVVIAAKSGVTKNIKDNSKIAGFPAIDINEWKKIIINDRKLRHKSY